MSVIIGPDDPALEGLRMSLSQHSELGIELRTIPWAEYRSILMHTLAEVTASSQALFVPGHLWIPELAHAGYLADIGELMSVLPQSLVEQYDKDDIFPSVWSECHYNHRLYQLPFFSDGHLLFYREDLVALDADQEVPVVSTEVLASLAKKVQGTSRLHGLALKADVSEIFTDYLPYMWEAGGRIFDTSGTPDLACCENIEALERYCVLRSWCPEKTHTYGNAEIAHILRTGEAALISNWGGQTAPILLDENNPWRNRYKVAVFPQPWNATWGIAIPENQPKNRQKEVLSGLMQLLGSAEDRRVASVAGSPVRQSSYSREQMGKYPWLAAQKRMLESAKILPKDPRLGLFLETLYEEIHKAFTGKISPRGALTHVQDVAIKQCRKYKISQSH